VADPAPTSSAHGPRLPGIVPIGSDGETVIEPLNPLVRLAVQFFVIPMAIVVFCVLLVFVFRWLTWENRDLSAYLSALNSATRSSSRKEQDALKLLNYIQDAKHWQSIYDVTEQLRFNRQAFLAENPDFPVKVAQIFGQSSGADRQVRQYLAQVLGLVGGPEVVSVLISALDDSDTETVIHSMVALGRIGDATAISHLVEASKSSDRGLRQTAIFVLGNFADPRAIARCAEALNDPDLLVEWNAAFALARQKDARAVPILERFLDEEYVQHVAKKYTPTVGTASTGNDKNQLATFHPERLEQYRATAVRLLGQFSDARIQKELQKAAGEDKQLKVRQAAIEALNHKKT